MSSHPSSSENPAPTHATSSSTAERSPAHAAQRTRRALVGGLIAGGALGTLGALPRAFAQSAPALDHGRLVVVFLRGAYDGLSAFVPWSDPEYRRLRPNIAVAAPDGTAATAIELDARFALHPALAPVLPMWKDGSLAIVPAAGSPDPTRSHFEAQHQWEIGMPGKTGDVSGWINRLAAMNAGPGRTAVALGIGEANPRILRGDARTRLIAKGQGATRPGVIGNERAREALLDLYSGNDRLSKAFREGVESRLMTAKELASEMNAADNGAAGSAAGLALDAQHLATLMRNDATLRLGFISAGGWDTHANQGSAQGLLANQFGNLARALVQLRADFNQPGDVILVMSEFGRTSAENGARGTDHGRGNAFWLIGDRITGGRVHGRWDGLAQGNLNEGRDLPVRHDFRAVIAQPLGQVFRLSDSRLNDLFPGATWDRTLDQLVRRA
ncbi:MAG: DUF1501 domain-containing protein [Proteobacteria bacterium]|nr:DUF1501 domain-containing protein [Burkholderiales bacterium]